MPAAAPLSPAPNGAADGWRVGRASVRSGHDAIRPSNAYGGAGHARPAAGDSPGWPPPPVTSYAASGGRMGTHGPWIFGAAAVAVALALVISAVGFSSGWFDSAQDTAKDRPAKESAAPKRNVTSYQGQGVTLNVPQGWTRRNVKHYVEFHDPKHDTSWLRINVTRDGRGARQILTGADRNFTRSCCGLTDYRKVGLRPAKLGGGQGAELEYVATRTNTGERRHGIWRIIVVDGRAYQVYMSVPQNRFKANQALFHEAVRSLKITG